MKNNGNGPSDNSNQGKPHLFRSLDSTNGDQNSLLGMVSATPVSRTHQVSRIGAQFLDLFLALFILTGPLQLTR